MGSIEKRREAVYFMADKGFMDDETIAALIEAFHAEDQGLKTSALWGLINTETFALDPLEVEALCRHAGDDRLSALAMVYLSNAYPERTAEILRNGLKSLNPRQREYACDEIGDRRMAELKPALGELLDDPDGSVREAATANLELLEAPSA
ncbi:MAG: HEAT repeat domain-containing protein [Blastocatellia bacterium]